MQNTSAAFDRILEQNHRVETNVSIGDGSIGFLITSYGEKIIFGTGVEQKIDDGHNQILSYPIDDNIVFGNAPYTGIIVDDGSGGSGYGENMIVSVHTTSAVFSGGKPTVGEAYSSEIDLKMYKPTGDIPRMAKVSPWVALVGEDEMSEWIQKGTFYIDTREYSDDGQGNTIMSIHGYDAMLKAEELFPLDCPLYDNGVESVTDIQVVNFIAEQMGVLVDPRTTELLNKGYSVIRPTDYTMREVLRFIAAMYAGNFIMSDASHLYDDGSRKEYLRFIPLRCIPDPTRFLVTTNGDAITFGAYNKDEFYAASGTVPVENPPTYYVRAENQGEYDYIYIKPQPTAGMSVDGFYALNKGVMVLV